MGATERKERSHDSPPQLSPPPPCSSPPPLSASAAPPLRRARSRRRDRRPPGDRQPAASRPPTQPACPSRTSTSARKGSRRDHRDARRSPRTPSEGSRPSRRRAPVSSIDNEGHIVTNQHVVDGATSISVRFWNGKTYKAELVGSDPSTDLAVIKVDAPASVLTPLTLGRLERGRSRRQRRRHRQPVRAREHRDQRDRQRPAPADDLAEQLLDRRLDPDGRRHQPRQLGRPAAQRRRPGRSASTRRSRATRAATTASASRSLEHRQVDRLGADLHREGRARLSRRLGRDDPRRRRASALRSAAGVEVATVTSGSPGRQGRPAGRDGHDDREPADVPDRRRRDHGDRRRGDLDRRRAPDARSTPSNPATRSRSPTSAAARRRTVDGHAGHAAYFPRNRSSRSRCFHFGSTVTSL